MEFRSTYKWGGGPDKTVLNSARLHDKNRFEVTVVYLRNKDDKEFILGEKGRSMGVDVIEVLEDHPVDLKAFKEVMKIIRDRKIDILHSRDYKTNFLALYLKLFKFKNLKIVTTAHGWGSKGIKISFYYLFDKIITSFFDAIFILYKDQLKDFIIHPPSEKTVVLHNAIDPSDWSPVSIAKSELRQELNLPENIPLIGFVGRIMPEKDLLSLVQIAEVLIHKKKIAVRFIIVGEGKDSAYETKVHERIKQFYLESFIYFLGPRNDLKEIYRNMDIFLLTSVKEGFPNTLLEAMAMKVPAVVSAVGGIPEIIEHRKTGMLCQPGRAGEFADCIEELIQNPRLGESLIFNARQLVENELSFERRLKKVEEQYINLLSGKSG